MDIKSIFLIAKTSISASIIWIKLLWSLFSNNYIARLWSFLAFIRNFLIDLTVDHFKFHFISFIEGFILIFTTRERCIMHKHVGTLFRVDKSISFSAIKPFNRSFQLQNLLFFLLRVTRKEHILDLFYLYQINKTI
jgi:hypothetical protein